ncbi:DNA polymerase I [Rhodopseudomonas sp. BR0C11]|uniref:DNA polymerase n=1 Tax=Rhodopseudomonas sp. BR0C11 TaxID=2269370 RepID=UPI0013DEC7F6|nr:DNA polymerase [Rhodopseudomonas sp. BR0C11]NEV76610.1 DNA polymerase I [Rhodopseudomonas sp. BR0C11]
MTDLAWRLFLFVKDSTGRGEHCFYQFEDGRLVETEAQKVVEFPGVVVCHDFWSMRDVLFDKTGTLPNVIVDLDEFRMSISGDPQDRLAREKSDITAVLDRYGADQEVCAYYKRMLNKGATFESGVAAKAAQALALMYLDLVECAKAAGEEDRFFKVEVPVYRLLQGAMASGILINRSRLSEMRAEVEYEYFVLLKAYSAKHDMPLETPTKFALEKKLRAEGFDLDDVSIDYLLEYVPHEHDFGGETRALQAADNARRVLGSLTLSTAVMRPVVDVFGSRTSRIQLRSPALQSIPKKYREIIMARDGYELSYVDYDQYEVGVMAALSEDSELMGLYAAGDMYELFASAHLGLFQNRKAAKQLFLSYAYGMSKKALVDAAVALGVDRTRAKSAFGVFRQYEAWKRSIWTEFQSKGSVATLLGNRYVRNGSGQLSPKEQRSAISQVVQGTASLIFKKALLEVGKLDDVSIILPMHDALLFEHKDADAPSKVVYAFERAMTTTLAGKVAGKASIGSFIS